MKYCSYIYCNNKDELLPVEKFYKDKSHSDGYGSRCKECCKKYNKTSTRLEYGREYRQRPEIKQKTQKYNKRYMKIYNARPERKKRQKQKRLKKEYNISLDEYNKLLLEQNKKCKICNTEISKAGIKGLVIDHNHTTNKIRGLLCTTCNLMLGCAKDNIEILKNGIIYLEENL